MTDHASAEPCLVTRIAELRAAVDAARSAGRQIGLVPTMGALHAGHVSLVDAAARECGFVVATVFVNPTQFGPHEDFQRYPRSLDADRDALRGHGADLIFAPNVEEVYPPGHATAVEVGGVAVPLEGARRAGHFRGVATVVLKLFNMVRPDVAYFGRKDYQQARVIEQMVADLNVPLAIRVCPIVREPDGLAMSSRNAYLAGEERRRALVLRRSLLRAQSLVAGGERDAEAILAAMRGEFATEPQVRTDYIALADPQTMAPVERVAPGTVALVAAFVGQTRLIDNEVLGPAE